MAGEEQQNTKRKKGHAQQHELKRQGRRSYKEDREIAELEQRLRDGAPPRGSNPLAAQEGAGATTSYAAARTFDELPLSQYTKDSLKKHKFVTLTAVQRATLPHALAGRDVLGAAKTGSGKTLSFLIPLVEKLYRAKWTRLDGLGALVLTPTRELAVQIFEELRKVGHFHDLSAGLLIGGKAVAEEAARVHRMAMLVATPGRLLQHMDETPGFDTGGLCALVLDEADRILDMGFAATLDAILAHLPRERQTLLFSATQTKSVRDLARLSLTDPEYLAVHAEAATPTPLKLQQAYMVVELGQKMDVMWSFIRTHLKAKTIIFLSTCKQVRFVFEAFRKLRPGVPLRCLHGGLKQARRTSVFYEFCNEKAMVLIATDIAARGLDFPTVDWVVQGDCPEDAATYIHRVGRTARYMSSGRALLLLLPSERDGMLQLLADAKVPLTQIRPNPSKQQAVTPALQALLSKDQELKDFAQKALTAYLRSVFLQPKKDVFDVTRLPVEDFAASIGLASTPKLRFLKRVKAGPGGKSREEVVEVGGKGALDESEEAEGEEEEEDEEEEDAAAARRAGAASTSGRAGATPAAGKKGKRAGSEEPEEEAAPSAKKQKGADGAAKSAKKANGAGAATDKADAHAADDDDDDDFLVVKKRNVFAEPEEAERLMEEAAAVAAGDDDEDGKKKKKKKKQKIKVGTASGNRMVFDEEGNALDPLAQLAKEGLGLGEQGEAAAAAEALAAREGVYVRASRPEERFRVAADLMRRRDKEDRARLKQLKKEIKLEKKARARAAALEEQGGGVAVLGRGGQDSEDDDDDGGSTGSDEEEDDGGRRRGGRGGRRGGDSDDDSEGSDEEEDEAQRGGPKRPEVAHFGMALKDAVAGAGAKPATAGAAAKAGSSLAEQEALALRLLSMRR
ncbi:hypothetical protein HXX76_004350 [Chlamydomonas incerta]|uniref:ATP-dependent RNA helicase n=1 Tax=Chlamydomonas incerta TaxID=51695 RepID=A0A835TBP5_CHLIN|nr:hypothetical protein HXX76_004350 [Chlamydomonas incerta]|eukprot:KAG2440238.1 hypothetical protein HXX76_004350 [Chlamydomonas incerta]